MDPETHLLVSIVPRAREREREGEKALAGH